MSKALYIFLMFLSMNCIYQDESPIKISTMPVKSKDALNITRCFNYYINYYKENPKIIDPQNFYSPYSREKSLNVFVVDTLKYSSDSLLVFAFIIIEKVHQNTNDTLFDSKAIIGYRKSNKDEFEIYPVERYGAIAFENSSKALEIVKYAYCISIKEDEDPAGNKFVSNVGDADFWAKSLYFRKINGLHYFELEYKNHTQTYVKLNYPKCSQR